MRLRGASFTAVMLMAGVAGAQDARQAATARTEGGAVRIDVIATDKKDNYLSDLTAKDFRVWQDNKEQVVTDASFSTSVAASPADKRNYVLLLFDNTSMDASGQKQIKDALFALLNERNPDLVLAVAEYNVGMRILRDFTPDPEAMKKAIEGVPMPSVRSGSLLFPGGASSGSVGGAPEMEQMQGRDFILSLGGLAGKLTSIPGHKTLLLLTSGFEVPERGTTEYKKAIVISNQANVTVYAADVRGVSGADSIAKETGGFVVRHSNNLLPGLRKIIADDGNYYTLSYMPPAETKSGCHPLRVKVSRDGVKVRSRSDYCFAEAQ